MRDKLISVRVDSKLLNRFNNHVGCVFIGSNKYFTLVRNGYHISSNKSKFTIADVLEKL